MRRRAEGVCLAEIDDLLELLNPKPVPGALAAFTETEALAPVQRFRDESPNYGAQARMREHDAMPEAWRALVHEYGLEQVRKQWNRLRVKNAEKAQQAIEVERLVRCLEAELPIF